MIEEKNENGDFGGKMKDSTQTIASFQLKHNIIYKEKDKMR